MRKDAGEIAALRAVNAAAEAGIALALERAAAGVSEAQLLAWVREAMVARGAEPLLGDVGIGERGALVDFVPGERELRHGDVIRFDVGCTLAGYHADLARTATFGRPPQWVEDQHAALRGRRGGGAAGAAPGRDRRRAVRRRGHAPRAPPGCRTSSARTAATASGSTSTSRRSWPRATTSRSPRG